MSIQVHDRWLTKDGLFMVRSWARDGYTKSEIANKIGIRESTIALWCSKYPEFREAIEQGKEYIDYQVENALLKAAMGYRVKETSVTVGAQTKNGKMFQVLREEKDKEVGPNATACIMWLNNRKPDKWKRNRDKYEDENGNDNHFTITIERGAGVQNDEDGINNRVTISTEKNDLKPGDLDYWPPDFNEADFM